jgi:hypothetical protein
VEEVLYDRFEFIGFFQNDVLILQEVVSEYEITVFSENRLGSFQTFLLKKPEVLKRFQKQF